MANNVIFTVCAKNYLAQALTLKQSVEITNPEVNFYIFLSDDVEDEELPEVVLLDDNWIPQWKKMAFKYNVIEFSTSIKPFCINYLFNKGYDIVLYIDPDVYVYKSLNDIFRILESKSIMLTPHRCTMFDNMRGPTSELIVSLVGVYNLGFIGIRNDTIGKRVVSWWKNRLQDFCYDDKEQGLFVDQKWMNFIVGYFPNDVYISHDLGFNMAIWNIQERELFIDDDTFKVRSIENPAKVYDLTFFHFSGYDPYKPDNIDKRVNDYTVREYPQYKKLLDDYREAEMKNGYDKYHSMSYSFNSFSDSTIILPINRRLYRVDTRMHNSANPFDTHGDVYKQFKKSRLLSCNQIGKFIEKDHCGLKTFGFGSPRNYKLLLKLVGIDRYQMIMRLWRIFSRDENTTFLLNN